MQHPQTLHEILDHFQTINMSQHVATGWPDARSMLRPTMLLFFASLKDCNHLAWAKLASALKRKARSSA